MARYRKEDHAKKKPAAPKAKKPAAGKSKAPSSTGRTRKPVDPKAPAVGQAMQDAAAAKGSTVEETFPQPTPIEQRAQVADALKTNQQKYSTARYPNSLSEDISHHTILSAMIDSLNTRTNVVRGEDPLTGKTIARGVTDKATKQILNITALAKHHADNALNAHLNGDSLSAAPHFLKATDLLHEALTHANNTLATRATLVPETGRLTPIVDSVTGVTKDSQLYGGFLRFRQKHEPENALSLHPMDTPKTLTDLANNYVHHALTSEFTNNTDVIQLAKKEGNLTREYKQGENTPSFSDVDVPGVGRTLSLKESEELAESKRKQQEDRTVRKAQENSMRGRTAGGVKFPIERVESQPMALKGRLLVDKESDAVTASREKFVAAKRAEVEGTVLEQKGKTKYFDVFTPFDEENAINEHRLQTRDLRAKAFDVWNRDQNRDIASKKELLTQKRGKDANKDLPKGASAWLQREPTKTFIGSPAHQDPEKFLIKMAVKDHWLAAQSKSGFSKSHEFEGTEAAANPEAYIEKNGLQHTGFKTNRLVPKGKTTSEDISEGRSTEGMGTPFNEEPETPTTSSVDPDEAKEAEFNKMSRGARNTAAFQEGGRK
jgi:hypothetical protein